jgi:outer membrane lipoprotein-sorting protein
MRKLRVFQLLLIFGLVAASISATAAELTATEVLQKMVSASKNTKTFQATYDLSISMGPSFSFDAPLAVAFEKPNKFRIEVTNSPMAMTMVSDGTKFYQYIQMLQQVQVSQAPKDFDQAGTNMQSQFKIAGMGFFSPADNAKALESLSKSAKLFGTRQLDGRNTYVLQMSVPNIGLMKYWVGTQDYRAYRVEVSPDANMISSTGQAMALPGMDIKFTMSARELKVDQPISSDVFSFKVPEGAQVVNEFSTPGAVTSPVKSK